MESYYEFASNQHHIAFSVLEGLKNKTTVPYFYSDADLNTGTHEWASFVHPAQQLAGKEIYYYAYIDNPMAYTLEDKNVLSYQEFLQTIK